MAYLIKPIKQTDLAPAIAVAMRRFEEMQALAQHVTDLRQSLDDRKLVERAKGVLMKQYRMDEAAAFRFLQKQASRDNRKLADLAREILAEAKG